MEHYFDHEKLRVYQDALAFVAWCHPILTRVTVRCAAKGHLDEASTSVVLNTAEGNGRYTAADRRSFFRIALASGLECAGCLDTLVAKSLLSGEEADTGKRQLKGIVSMLFGLMGGPTGMVGEEDTPYGPPDGSLGS